jgi:ABC-type dipeptide/oligopeptide/nickel transport system permease subunit
VEEMTTAKLSSYDAKPARPEKSSLLRETLERVIKGPGAKVGVVLLTVIALACIAAPLLTPYGVNDMDLDNMYSRPSRIHLLGTDELGRDLLTRLLYGGRYSLSLGLTAALFGGFVSVILGSIAGYFGGKTEIAIMRMIDIWSSLPAMLMAILISATLGTGFFNTILALSFGEVPPGTRLIRGQILKERTKEYLEAAESINCSKFAIMFKHLLPNVVQPILVHMTMGIGFAITMAAALSYIGLGVRPPTPEWGAILAQGRSEILTYPYLIMFPGIVIALTVLAINLIGDGLRDALDPKLRD